MAGLRLYPYPTPHPEKPEYEKNTPDRRSTR